LRPDSVVYTGDAFKYDPENKWNLNHINNEDAIGYNNLEARAADMANNGDIAHSDVFDRMLADYFLGKRGEIKESNKLMKELETAFSAEGFPEHAMGIAS